MTTPDSEIDALDELDAAGAAALDLAIDTLGGNTAMGAAIGVSVSTVGMWKGRGRGKVPAENCLAIEAATRGLNALDSSKPIVTCEMLRPKLKWGVVRNESLPASGAAQPSAEPASQGQGA